MNTKTTHAIFFKNERTKEKNSMEWKHLQNKSFFLLSFFLPLLFLLYWYMKFEKWSCC